ncbi:MAG: MBL fold metallo-hydrolase [Burkholderiales bacterium]|nr:MAG: MBL fold metallo-hydrolase [Burkholderiales bacterium]
MSGPVVSGATPALPASLRFIERDWLSSNQVLGFENGEAIVVDTGYDKHAALTVELVRRALADAGAARLSGIVNTHLHSDHCGGNYALSQAYGCSITVPQASAADVEAWDEEALTYAGTGQRCARFRHDATLAPGDTLRLGGVDWQALAAPGHDPKSLIFHCEREGLLISADALWEHGFGLIFPELDGRSGFDEQRAVLELIATLPVDLVLPGHGRAFGDVPGALDRAFTRLDAMRADPRRHARHALKVLVKFLMLDLERIEAAHLVDPVRRAAVMHRAAALIGLELEEALDWAAGELVAQGQLRREGGWLANA